MPWRGTVLRFRFFEVVSSECETCIRDSTSLKFRTKNLSIIVTSDSSFESVEGSVSFQIMRGYYVQAKCAFS